VEDWFHSENVKAVVPRGTWDLCESRVARNTERMLQILEDSKARATFFVLGWVAERFPGLVPAIAAAGHEVASHGYAHQLVTGLTPDEFRADVRRAKAILEDASGTVVAGYRAPGFSITRDNLWAFDVLLEEGYRFDSSIFPAPHGHGGIPGAPKDPFALDAASGRMLEFPVTQAVIMGRPLCFSGGGYLRLLPLPVISTIARSLNAAGRPIVYYTHPREIDPAQPRLPMPLKRRFKSYVNIASTAGKLRHVANSGAFRTMGDWLRAATLPSVAVQALAGAPGRP
jgi:polysaccharide deacetylase family protein (PEP-CTERM system associated)